MALELAAFGDGKREAWSRIVVMRRAARYDATVEVTSYFERNVLDNPDRLGITKEMCEAVVDAPEHSERQPDGRLRFWGRPEGRETYLLVVVTSDGTALHNAFFDSNFTRKQRRQR